MYYCATCLVSFCLLIQCVVQMVLKRVTGQLADMPTRGLPTRGLVISRLVNSWTRQLAHWTTRALDKSRTGQLAVSQMPPKEWKLSMQSPVVSASCTVCDLSSTRVRELTSTRDVQSASRPVRELAYPRVSSNLKKFSINVLARTFFGHMSPLYASFCL